MATVSREEMEFIEEARDKFDRHPEIDCYIGAMSVGLIALRGYEDEIELFRVKRESVTFTGQIKVGKNNRKIKVEILEEEK